MLRFDIKPEKAVLIGLITGRQTKDKAHDFLGEFKFLHDSTEF
ncbi:MAG: hypothetical protein WC780_06615 [Lentimicrobiaceae bacterium]|jgi:hypothetical protein